MSQSVISYSLSMDRKGFYIVDSLQRKFYFNSIDDMEQIVHILNRDVLDWHLTSLKLLDCKRERQQALDVIDWFLQNKHKIDGLRFKSRDEFFIYAGENGAFGNFINE